MVADDGERDTRWLWLSAHDDPGPGDRRRAPCLPDRQRPAAVAVVLRRAHAASRLPRPVRRRGRARVPRPGRQHLAEAGGPALPRRHLLEGPRGSLRGRVPRREPRAGRRAGKGRHGMGRHDPRSAARVPRVRPRLLCGLLRRPRRHQARAGAHPRLSRSGGRRTILAGRPDRSAARIDRVPRPALGTRMAAKKVAFITGASRGIGRGCALELSRRGFDLVLSARTVTGHERFEHSSTVRKSLTDPLPGSLEATAREARGFGAEALVVKLDLAARADWQAAVDAALERFGRIDVLINNGRYVGPGHMDPFEDTPVELIEQMMLCNVIAPLTLVKLCLPAMKRQGCGIVINITSSAGERETPAPIGQGGWGLGYSLSKAAFNRMVPGLAKELRPYNIAVIGLMPGFVGTERMAAELGEFGFDASRALPVENPGRVCAMLATAKDPMHFSGKDIYGPDFHAEHALVRFD